MTGGAGVDRRRFGGPAPARSDEQRREALVRANEVRSYRAQLKLRMQRGEGDPRGPLLNPAPLEESMKVYDLLVSLPKVGRVKANRILSRAHVSPSKTLGGLTERQRRMLLAELPAAARRSMEA